MSFNKDIFIRTALSLKYTNYVLHSYSPRIGLDCATFVHFCLLAANYNDAVDIPLLDPDFGLHKKDDTYLNRLNDYFTQVKEPLKGDLILIKYGKSFSHLGIVLEHHNFIHCCINYGVRIDPIDVDREVIYYRVDV